MKATPSLETDANNNAKIIANAKVKVEIDKKNISLTEAVKRGDVCSVKKLLKEGADANAIVYLKDQQWEGDAYKSTPLQQATDRGCVKITNLLLRYGADVHLTIQGQTPPVLSAAAFGNTEVLQLLLKHGANANIKGSDGKTPLITATIYNHPASVKALLSYGADVHVTWTNNKLKPTALLCTCAVPTWALEDLTNPSKNYKKDIAKLLLSKYKTKDLENLLEDPYLIKLEKEIKNEIIKKRVIDEIKKEENCLNM